MSKRPRRSFEDLRRAVSALPELAVPWPRERPQARPRPEARGLGEPLKILREDIDWFTEKRFWEKVERLSDPDGCWLWTGALNDDGYGSVGWGVGDEKRVFLAHRVAYVLAGHSLDPQLDLDHTCTVRSCVNDAHLEQVTKAENNRRALERKRSRG